MKDDIANELFVMNNITVEKLFELGADAFTLYAFYYKTAKWQKTMEPWANNEYVMKNLGWGRPRLLKTKAQLEKAQMIEQVRVVDEKTNQVQKWAIKLKYLQTVSTSQVGTESTSQFFPPVDGCDCNNIYNNKISKELNNNNIPPCNSPQGEQLREHFKDLWNNKLIAFYKQCYPHNVQLQKITRASLKHLPARDKELKSLVKELIADGVITAEDVGDDVWRWAFTQIWERIQRSSFLRGTAAGYEGFVPNAEFILAPSKFIKIVTPVAISKYGLDDKR